MFTANAIERMDSFVVATRLAAMAPVGMNSSTKAIAKQHKAVAVWVAQRASQQKGSAAKKQPSHQAEKTAENDIKILTLSQPTETVHNLFYFSLFFRFSH